MDEDEDAEKHEKREGDKMDGLIAAFSPVQAGQSLSMFLFGMCGILFTGGQPGADMSKKVTIVTIALEIQAMIINGRYNQIRLVDE